MQGRLITTEIIILRTSVIWIFLHCNFVYNLTMKTFRNHSYFLQRSQDDSYYSSERVCQQALATETSWSMIISSDGTRDLPRAAGWE